MRVTLVIPALDEAATIGAVLDSRPSGWGAVVVDDGSTDATGEIASAHGATVLHHTHPRGYDAALSSGLEHARAAGFEIAVTIDADGQLSMQSAERAVAHLQQAGCDLVLGRRPAFARWSERLFAAYGQWRYGVADILCGLKVYRLGAFAFMPRLDMQRSIGTAIALAGLRRGLCWSESGVAVRPRADASRFGIGWRANQRILAAAARAIWSDLTVAREHRA